MGIIERKERERREMRERILDAAMILFVEQGFDQVSIRKIAERIEYSPATIYLYFKDKDEMFLALHNRAFTAFYEHLAVVQKIRDPLKRLRKAAEAYIKFALEHQEFYDLMFIMRAPMRAIEHGDHDIGLRSYETLRSNIEDCVKAGVLAANTDINAATFAMWSFVHGMVSLVIRRPYMTAPEQQIQAIVRGALDFIMKSLG